MSYANVIMYSSILPGYDDYEGGVNTKGTIFSSEPGRTNGFGGFIKTMKGLKNGDK